VAEKSQYYSTPPAQYGGGEGRAFYAALKICLTLILTAWEFKNFKKIVKMKLSPGWHIKAKYFLKIKNALQKILTNFFLSEVFIKNVIFSMILMIIYV
jgi:hypothetical protein